MPEMTPEHFEFLRQCAEEYKRECSRRGYMSRYMPRQRICVECGAEFLGRSRAKRCPICRPEYVKSLVKAASKRRWAKSLAQRERVRHCCVVCATEFTPKTRRHFTCSEECRDTARREYGCRRYHERAGHSRRG